MFDPSSINPSSIFGFVAPCFGKSGNIRLKQCDEDAFGPIKLRTSFDSTATDVLLRENAPTVVSAAPTSDCFRKCRRCIEDRQTVAFTGFYGICSRKFSKKFGNFFGFGDSACITTRQNQTMQIARYKANSRDRLPMQQRLLSTTADKLRWLKPEESCLRTQHAR